MSRGPSTGVVLFGIRNRKAAFVSPRQLWWTAYLAGAGTLAVAEVALHFSGLPWSTPRQRSCRPARVRPTGLKGLPLEVLIGASPQSGELGAKQSWMRRITPVTGIRWPGRWERMSLWSSASGPNSSRPVASRAARIPPGVDAAPAGCRLATLA